MTEIERVLIPKAPIDGVVLERVDTNQPIGVVDGVVTEVDVVQAPSSLAVTISGVTVEAKAGTGSGGSFALTDDGRLRMVSGKTISVIASGFAPRSRVEVWLYHPKSKGETYIDAFEGDERGSIDLAVAVPNDLESGAADLVVVGSSSSGDQLVVGVPVSIEYSRDVAGFSWSILSALLFAIGGGFMFLVMRRQSIDPKGD